MDTFAGNILPAVRRPMALRKEIQSKYFNKKALIKIIYFLISKGPKVWGGQSPPPRIEDLTHPR